ncbi:hypothetical protein UlMin_025042 [Ulmus minor]
MDMEGLSVICAGLGVAEEDLNGNRIGYSKGEYCLDNLKDLLRFLRRDDPQNRDVFKQVCKWNTVAKDLIPIIEHCQEDRNLVLNAVKVLVFLTMPIDPSSNDISQQIEYLWGLKSSITCSEIIAVTVSLLESPLENLERDAFTEEDWKLSQLILTLFRNLLAIQEISLQQKAEGTASHFLSLRDRFMELLFRENVMDLILVITQHFGGYFRHDNLLLLEIFHYIFLGQEPALIAKAHRKGSKVDGDSNASFNSLKSIMDEEEERRRLSRQRNLARHSNFSGTFTRLTVDGSKAVFNGKPTSVSSETLLKPHKVQRGRIKKIAWNNGSLPSSNEEILDFLHDFANQFLSGGYNVLMQSIREDIEKEHHTIQRSDIIVFFQVAQFVTSFQYHKFLTSKSNMGADAPEDLVNTHADNTYFEGNICGPIAATMNESMFQLVFSNWRSSYEALKETHEFKFMSAAGSLMKNMICMLDLVLKVSPEDSKESQTARILLYKLFYDQTDQGLTQFLLNLLKSFDTHKQAKSDLEDLVQMIYKIVELMENLQVCGTLRVARKSRKGRKKKALINKEKETEILGEHSTVQNEIDVSTGEQPSEASDADKGVLNANSDEKDIIDPAQADNCEASVIEADIIDGSSPQKDKKNSDHANDDLYGTGDSSGGEQVAVTNEVDLNVSTLISSFGNNNIIHKLCWLLKFYKSNSSSSNNCIIRILRRITDDLELSPMLYQLSLLTTFYDILAEQKSCPCKEYTNIVDFLTSLVRKMLKKMKNQPLLFVEVLFWKTRKECHYIDAEYLLHELGHLRQQSKNWESISGDVDFGSSQAKEWKRISIADALGEDEADVVISHEQGIENREKSVDDESARVSKIKKRLVLGPELDETIRDLYEKFKDSQHCTRLIAEHLDPDGKVSSVQVSKKLKQFGLKCASKKRLRHADKSIHNGSNKLDGDKQTVDNAGSKSNILEQNLSSQPRQARKRVRAFSEEEEASIRSLYEQFKDHKRCSYMIANALDTENKFTASQVSRKLKQLGLHVPQRKRSQSSILLRDEDDLSTEIMHESDDETLISLMNRSKKRDSSGLFSQEVAEQTTSGKLSEEDSDAEMLSSIQKKRRGSLSKSKTVKHTVIPKEMMVSENGLENGAEKGVEEWDVSRHSSVLEPTGVDEVIAADHVSPNDIRESKESINLEPTGVDEGDAVDHVTLTDIGDSKESINGSRLKDVINDDDELADSEDEVVDHSESSRSALVRRRMIVDIDDDDD